MDYVVVSKDRACQLDLHLRCAANIKSLNRVFILWTASDTFFEAGYKAVNDKYYPNLTKIWVREEDFKTSLRHVVNMMNSKYFLLQCDDHYFIDWFPDSVDIDSIMDNPEIHSLSLRMTDRMHTNSVTQSPMTIPVFLEQNSNLLVWDWTVRDKRLDWGYPMAVASTIFRTEDIQPLLASLDYNNSNKLESLLNNNRMRKPLSAAVNRCCVIDLPMNSSAGSNNPTSNISLDYLNRRYLAGDILSTKMVYGIPVRDTFMFYDIPLQWDGENEWNKNRIPEPEKLGDPTSV